MASSGAVPYGYIRGESSFLVDQETREIVVRIFRMRERGMALNAIARSLNEEHIMSPGKLRYMRGMTARQAYQDCVWNRKAIKEILQNEAYLGHRVHGKVKREKLGTPKKRTDSSAWQYIYHAHEPIVCQELFDAVQKINEKERQHRESFRCGGELKEDFRAVLKGKLICGDCGKRMAGLKRIPRSGSKLPPVIVYQCSSHAEYLGRQTCFSHYIPEAEILKKIENVLNANLNALAETEQLLLEFKKQKKADQNSNAIQRRKAECEAKKERLWQDYADRLLNKEEYLYAKQKYEAMYQDICREEDAVRQKKEEMALQADMAFQWIEHMKRYKKIQKLDQGMIDFFVKEIRVFDRERVEIVLNFRDEFLEWNKEKDEMGVKRCAG